MAKRTPEAPILTYDDMVSGKSLPIIEEYLNLKTPLNKVEGGQGVPDSIDSKIAEKAQESYERHFYYLQKLRS
jgi:hypothetical protein